jgi:tRNA threonylcarbamoyl adenosine modification protein YeaZ
MVLVIDTSSVLSGLALLRRREPSAWEAQAEVVFPSGRGEELADRVRTLVDPAGISEIGMALGPGSFTGLRTGVSYGLGLALARGLPIYGLGSLELAAARAPLPTTALVEAGRGRVYFLVPGGSPEQASAGEIPIHWPVTGWLRPETIEILRTTAKARLITEEELRPFSVAAAQMMTEARPLSYGSVKLRYMPSSGPLRT